MKTNQNKLSKKFLFIFAHPDDESFYSGGLISKIKRNKGEARVVSLTNGDKGNIHQIVSKNKKMGLLRQKELSLAAAKLGATSSAVGKFHDSKLDQTSRVKLIDFIFQEILNFAPNFVVTFGDEPFYNHTDHIETEEVVEEAIAIVNKYSKNKITLWKRGYANNQISAWYELRKNKRKRSRNTIKRDKKETSYQKGGIEIKLEKEDIKNRHDAILIHKSQKPEIFAEHLLRPINNKEYYEEILP